MCIGSLKDACSKHDDGNVSYKEPNGIPMGMASRWDVYRDFLT